MVTKFKQTPIGLLPDDWMCKKIGEFADATSGGTPSTQVPEFWNGSIPWMNSGDLNKKRVFAVNGRITPLGLNNSSTKLIPPLSVLLGLAGQGKTRGTAAINYVELAINQSIGAILPSDKFVSEFIYQYLDNSYDYIRDLSSGGGRGGISLSFLKNIYCPIPSLPEQKAIAEALSDIDQLISATEKLIAKKQDIKKGLMQNLLDPDSKVRLPGYSGKWKTFVLSKLGKAYSGLSGKSAKDFERGNSHFIPYLNIYENSVINVSKVEAVNINDNEKQNAVRYGDIFFTTSSETPEEVGMSSVLLADVCDTYLNSFCFGFRLHNFNDLLPQFAAYYFRSDFMRAILNNLAQGATRYNISKTKLLKSRIVIPATIAEQQAIASLLADVDRDIESVISKLRKLRYLKAGMMSELLTGRIRLNANQEEVKHG